MIPPDAVYGRNAPAAILQSGAFSLCCALSGRTARRLIEPDAQYPPFVACILNPLKKADRHRLFFVLRFSVFFKAIGAIRAWAPRGRGRT